MILKFILLLLEMKKQANFFIRSLSIHLLKILHSEDKKKTGTALDIFMASI